MSEGLRRHFLEHAGRPGPGPFPRTGYYHFLGQGDFQAGHPVSLWELADWERWFDRLRAAGHSRVWLLVNGYTLAYRSRAYPELVDPAATGAREPGFLNTLVAAGHARGLAMHAVVTTDGHAAGFVNRHPELAAVDREGKRTGDDLMCLEEPLVQRYLLGVFEEVIAENAAWDGVVFHPTETCPLRFNAVTRARYRAETGRELPDETDETVMAWCNRRFAAQMKEWVEFWQARVANLDPVMFNCWWINDHLDAYRAALPARARVCVWDYDVRFGNWRGRPLVKWAKAFGPGRIIYMPSSGGYPEHGRPPVDEPLVGYDRLLTLAAHLGIRECVFFAGWGAGGDEEQRLDAGLLRGCSAALIEPTEALLDALDADWASARARIAGEIPGR